MIRAFFKWIQEHNEQLILLWLLGLMVLVLLYGVLAEMRLFPQ
jgi:hypothetical protein